MVLQLKADLEDVQGGYAEPRDKPSNSPSEDYLSTRTLSFVSCAQVLPVVDV